MSTGRSEITARDGTRRHRAGSCPSATYPKDVALRAPHLQLALRSFVLGAFAFLLRELEEGGADLPFAFDEHEFAEGPALYEYRPLVRGFVEERAERAPLSRRRPDRARRASARAGRRDLRPRARRARSRPRTRRCSGRSCSAWSSRRPRPAAASTGTTPRSSASTPSSRRPSSETSRTYRAVAPLTGLTVVTQLELAPGLRIRAVRRRRAGQALARGPGTAAARLRSRARSLLRARAVAPDSTRERSRRTRRPSWPTRSARSGWRRPRRWPPGPVLFETLDGRPFGIRPVLPIAATQPPGESTRLDTFRGALAGELLLRLALADEDDALAEALDRWELSLFQNEPFRGEQLRSAFSALLGETWPLRGALLLERRGGVARAPPRRPRRLAAGEDPTSPGGRRGAPRPRPGAAARRPR